MAHKETWINLISIMATFQLVTTLQGILKLTILFANGQSLSKASKDLTEALEGIYAREAHKMSTNMAVEFETFIRNFGMKVPIRPMDLFELTMSSGLKAFSVLVTYVVIMLQFKLGEI